MVGDGNGAVRGEEAAEDLLQAFRMGGVEGVHAPEVAGARGDDGGWGVIAWEVKFVDGSDGIRDMGGKGDVAVVWVGAFFAVLAG